MVELEFIRNILITLSLFGMVYFAIYKTFPQLQSILEDLLFKSLSRNLEDNLNHPLRSVFYEYSHNSSADWVNWAKGSDDETKVKAYGQLVEHLEGSPKHWGYITLEVVGAIAKFEDPRDFDILVDFMARVKELWGRYKSIPLYYETICRLLVGMNPMNAKKLFSNELQNISTVEIGYQDKKLALITSISILEQGMGADAELAKIIVDANEMEEVRFYAISAASVLVEEESLEVSKIVAKHFIENTRSKLNPSDKKILKKVLFDLCLSIEDEDIWTLIIEACKVRYIEEYAIPILRDLIVDSKIEMSPERLFNVFNLEDNDVKDLTLALAKRSGLTSDELSFVSSPGLQLNEFCVEEILEKGDDESEYPLSESLKSSFNKIIQALSKGGSKSVDGDELTGGGLILGGESELEKIYLTKAVATSKKLSFIHVNPAEITTSYIAEKLIWTISRMPKPILVCVSDLRLFFKVNGEFIDDSNLNKLYRVLERYSSDPMFFIISSVPDLIEESKPDYLKNVSKRLFPVAFDIKAASMELKSEVFNNCLLHVSEEKRDENIKPESILTDKYKSIIECEAKALHYFKTCLLIHGKLVPADEYAQLVEEYERLNKDVVSRTKEARAEKKVLEKEKELQDEIENLEPLSIEYNPEDIEIIDVDCN